MGGFRSNLLNVTTGVPQGSTHDVHFISDKFNFIANVDDTTLTSPLLTFTRGGVNGNIDTISSEMN